mgnify:CR=1 FL=1
MTARRRFTAEFKARVALAALRGDKTIQEIAGKHKVHPNQVSAWKRQAMDGLGAVFSNGPDKTRMDHDDEVHDLQAKIGQWVFHHLPYDRPGAGRHVGANARVFLGDGRGWRRRRFPEYGISVRQSPCSNAANSSISIAVRRPPRPMLSLVDSPSIFDPLSRLMSLSLFRVNRGVIQAGTPLSRKSMCPNRESPAPSTSDSLRETIK